jgi:glyoxylase-like metal-dependent hydrolase (beta-lactamase superfamily II)
MKLEIRILTLGLAVTNCYLLADTQARTAVVIDPVDQAPLIAKTASDAGWTITHILATHAHFDHVLASKELKELTGVPFWICEAAVPMLKTLPQQGYLFGTGAFPAAATPDRLLLTTPETLTPGSIRLETLYTPGHAPGHLAFYLREAGVVFSGDALFAGSIGRTDLPGGDYLLLMESIRDKLLTLPDETRVLSGHGEPTTVGRERQTNPFLLED